MRPDGCSARHRCNVPRSEESYLALSDLALGLQRHYETNYADIGAMMTQVAHDPIQTDWAEAFLQLPQQLPPSINQQSRALLVNLRKVVQPPNLPPPQPTQPNRLLITSGWLVAAVLAILLVLASRR